MTPPQLHMSFDESLSAGMLAISTVGHPGIQGAVVIGTQGIGVNTPKAAAVAEATVGFASEEHIANGRIFIIGTLSMIFAAGDVASTLFVGMTVSALGAAPNEHCSVHPETTSIPINPLLPHTLDPSAFKIISRCAERSPFKLKNSCRSMPLAIMNRYTRK